MPNAGKWTLRRRVTALLAVVSLLLISLAVAEAVVATQNRSYTDAVLTKTGPMRVQGQEILNALLDQESGVRDYANSGDRSDLVPYGDGLKQEQGLVASMTTLSRDYPAVSAELSQVVTASAAWRRDVAEPVIATTGRDGPEAGQALLTEQARQQFEQVRNEVEDLQAEILEARQRDAADIVRTSNLLVILLVVAAVVFLVAGTVLLLSLDRIVVRPITRLAEQIREVARGDYQHGIAANGPPELIRLGRDVDVMRQRIAADLAEVRAARERIEWVNSQLQKQAEELTRSNRDLEQFAYVASHDLQEPLRKVASFCQLLQRRYAGKLDDRADQYIAFAVDGAQRMQRLINDLLAFSRIGRLTNGFSDVDLNDVLREVAGQTESARDAVGGELTWSDLPVVRGEEPLLTNLLANLVSNSLKFRRPGEPPRVHVSARRLDGEWEITCQDNGIGIEPEFADKIFVIFQRLHSREAYPGTGIGLAIVKKIVEYHGGRVWVDTDVPEGTAIRFTLPIAEGSEVDPGAAAAPAPGTVEDATPGVTGGTVNGGPGGSDTVGANGAGSAPRPDGEKPSDAEPADRLGVPDQRRPETGGTPPAAGTAPSPTGDTDG